jgi:hypothetical protein
MVGVEEIGDEGRCTTIERILKSESQVGMTKAMVEAGSDAAVSADHLFP